MKRIKVLFIAGIGILSLYGCNQPGTTTTFAPLSLPMPTPTPACGFTNLGTVLCGAASQGLTVIRTLAQWNAFAGGTTCAGTTAPPIADFNTQMVLVYSGQPGIHDPRTSFSFSSACLYSDHMAVTLELNYNESIMAPVEMGPCLCQNTAIAVPQTALPIDYTQCDNTLNFTGVVSTSCSTTVF